MYEDSILGGVYKVKNEVYEKMCKKKDSFIKKFVGLEDSEIIQNMNISVSGIWS